MKLLPAVFVMLAPSGALADVDLRVHDLNGILDDRALSHLEADLLAAKQQGQGLLMVVDSPGGKVVSAEKAMLAVLFAGIPVVAYVPGSGRASGAALLPLMGSTIIAMAPTARIGSRKGLGRLAELELGPFGERLFSAARESRGGAVDWMIVALADGGVLNARGARKRGLVAEIAPSLTALGRRLRGRTMDMPLTGEEASLSGRIVQATGSRWWSSLPETPLVLAVLLSLGLCLVAWAIAYPAASTLLPIGLVALALSVRVGANLPVFRPSLLLVGLAAVLVSLGAMRRAGALITALAAPLFALGAVLLMDIEAPGHFLDESAGVGGLRAVLVAIPLVLVSLAFRRRSLPERWNTARVEVELPRSTGGK